MQNQENWKKVTGFEKYSVSDYGNIRNDKTGRILKFGTSNNGYRRVTFSQNKKLSTKNVHRLVAGAFIPNPDNKKCVDHINNDRKNNKLNNLRWATAEQNQHNRKIDKDNTSGTKGVSFVKKTNKWRARINIDGKEIYLGSFMKKEDAVNIRIQRAKDEFGEYLNACEIILNV